MKDVAGNRMRKLFTLTTAMAIAGAIDAQPIQRAEQPIVVTTTTVQVPVTVLDKAGNTISGLTPYDFRLFDNNKLQRITEDLAEHPLSVVVVIQANRDVEAMIPKIVRQSSV